MKKLYIILLLIILFGCSTSKQYYGEYDIISNNDTIIYDNYNKWNHTGESYVDEPIVIPDYLRELSEENEKIKEEDYHLRLKYKELRIETEKLKEKRLQQENLLKLSSSPFFTEDPINVGTLVYKVDSILIIGATSTVEARIIKKVGKETTTQLVAITTHTTSGLIYEEIIEVGDIMYLKLNSLDKDAIIVNPLMNEQLVDEKDPSLWLWGITANKIGNYNLLLTARIKQNGIEGKNKLVFNKEINIVNKPKKKYSIFVSLDKFKRYKESNIKVVIVENNLGDKDFEWGGEGKVEINFDGNVDFVNEKNIINDKKSEFGYKWTITPEGKEKIIPFNISIKGEYENLEILKDTIIVEKNIKESFNKFVDNAVKRWYWLFTALLIPFIGFIRKKYLQNNKK